MPISLARLREQLSDIEPNESTYEGIGPSEVGSLRVLLEDEEDWLAARAVYALSRIDSEDARRALVTAAESPRMAVRVATAVSARALPPQISDEILLRLLSDSESSVRKFAIKSTSTHNSEPVKRRISEISVGDNDSRLRQAAGEQSASIGDG